MTHTEGQIELVMETSDYLMTMHSERQKECR
jgi:hypothetical protein